MELNKKALFNENGDIELSKRKMINGNTTNLNDFNNVKYTWTTEWYRNAMNNFWIPEEINLFQDLKDYKNLFSNFSEESKNQSKELITAFKEFATYMAEENSKAFIEALNKTIKDFNNNLIESFGSNFKQLNEAVIKLVDWQEHYKETIESTTENQRMIFDSFTGIEKELQTFSSETKNINSIVTELSTITKESMEQNIKLNETLSVFSELNSHAKELIPNLVEINNNIDNDIKTFNSYSNELIDNLNNFANNLQNNFSQYIDDINKGVKGSTDNIIGIMEDSIKKIEADIIDAASENKTGIDKNKIKEIYHSNNGILGHRQIKIILQRLYNINISKSTAHKYLNKELKLFSIVRPKKPNYKKGKPHKIFENLLKQDFYAEEPDKIWCTDFTYLKLTDGSFRYNCSILDLYDRSIVSSITAREMTSELAIKTLEKALRKVKKIRNKIILHSDQGSQYSSKKFVEYCKKNMIQQSMSRAGCPYDNAPMERYFNTLKNELINHYYYKTEKEIYELIEEFAYVWYNHVRPHSYNDYMTPSEKRKSFKKVNKEINFN